MSRPRTLWTAPELRLAAVLCVAGTALLLLGLGVAAERTHALMLDFRRWTPVSSLSPEADEFFESIQTPIAAQRPFRVTLRLERPPVAGDVFAVERAIAVGDAGRYCFDVLTFSDYYRPTKGAIATFRVVVSVNGVPHLTFPIADREDGEMLSVDGIVPVDGEVRLRFEVQAHVTRPSASWQRASTVHFEHARLYRCSADELSAYSSRPPRT